MTTLKFADTHNMVVFLSKPTESDGFEKIVDFLNEHPIRHALTINPTIYISCIEQIWSIVKVKTINGEVHLHALVDDKKIIITEASVRRDLQLADEEDTVMSDSEDSTVTYTEVSSPFVDLSDIGSPRVDGPPMMPEDPYAYVVAAFQAPPSPDYVPGQEEPEQAPPSPVYVPYVLESAYPEFMPPEDKVLPAEEHPLPVALLPTADSPGYVPKDDGDDEDESSDDDKDDDVDIEEEEEHVAPANSIIVTLPAVDHVPSAEETKPFETDESAATPPPHPAYWRLPNSLLYLLHHHHHFPYGHHHCLRFLLHHYPPILSPLPVSSPPPASPTYPLGYRAAMIRLRAKAPSTSHSPPPHIILSHTRADTPQSGTSSLLPTPLHTLSPSLLLPSTDHGADRPEVCLPPRKRLCFAFGPRYEVRESSFVAAARPTGGFRANYGFVATMDREIRHNLERDIEFATRVRQDTDKIYVRLDDEQTERQLMAGRLNMLYRDRRAHAHTTLVMEREARMRQAQFIESLKLLKRLQTQMTKFESQQGLAKGSTQPDAAEEAGSSS
ncbi:hypothetical protein Tco_0789726 [Tanacetum coccineum]